MRNRINEGRENQIKNMDFDKLFARYSRQNSLILETHLKTKNPFGTKTADALETLNKLLRCRNVQKLLPILIRNIQTS